MENASLFRFTCLNFQFQTILSSKTLASRAQVSLFCQCSFGDFGRWYRYKWCHSQLRHPHHHQLDTFDVHKWKQSIFSQNLSRNYFQQINTLWCINHGLVINLARNTIIISSLHTQVSFSRRKRPASDPLSHWSNE